MFREYQCMANQKYTLVRRHDIIFTELTAPDLSRGRLKLVVQCTWLLIFIAFSYPRLAGAHAAN